jgi:hypothetical protein
MTYQTYEKSLKIIFSFFGIFFVIDLLKSALDQNSFAHVLFAINYFCIRILVLFFLFFAIYAQVTKVKETKKLEKPFIFIFFGLLAVAAYIGVPIAFYFMTTEIDLEPHHLHNSSQLEEIQKEATDVKLSPKLRQVLARQFYLDTGKAIFFLDSNNDKVTYSPDNETIKYRNKMKEAKDRMAVVRLNGKITAYSLIVLLFLSLFSFLAFLGYKSKSNISTTDT